jgi:tetratricopeptide (TPR) repeat protein
VGDTLDYIADFGIVMELWGIGKGIERLREEQLDAAREIVAHLGMIEEAIAGVIAAIEGQTAVIRQGFRQLDDRLATLTLLQTQALRAMKYRRETEALAARENGERAMRNHYYPEALDDFQRALADNKYDFIAHFLIALILWEEQSSAVSASDSCNACIKYTKMWDGGADDPTPRYFESRADVVLGRIAESEHQMARAFDYYLAAYTSSPDYGECFRRCAGAALALGDRDLALECVRAAMLIDPGELVLLMLESALAPLRKDVLSISEELRNEQSRAIDATTRAAIGWANALTAASGTLGEDVAAPEEFSSLMQRAHERGSRGFIDVAYVPSELTLGEYLLMQATTRAREGARKFVKDEENAGFRRLEAAHKEASEARQLAAESEDRSGTVVGCVWIVWLIPILFGPLMVFVGLSGGEIVLVLGGGLLLLPAIVVYVLWSAYSSIVMTRGNSRAKTIVEGAERSFQRAVSAAQEKADSLLEPKERVPGRERAVRHTGHLMFSDSCRLRHVRIAAVTGDGGDDSRGSARTRRAA